jgi:hypothetical protein
MLPTAEDVMLQVARMFDTLEVTYFVGGSIASSSYGEPRITNDVDFVADLGLTHARPLFELLQDEFTASFNDIRSAISRRRMFNAIHTEAILKIDVYPAKKDAYSQCQLTRRNLIFLKETQQPLYLSTPEDTILAKLDWHRRGNYVSQRQLRDVAGVLRVRQHDLDFAYMREWASVIGVDDLLETALAQVLLP